MKRLGTLVMAVLLITGCNAMQPNMEETELLWAETEKNIQKWAWDADDNTSPIEMPMAILELRENIPQEAPVSAAGAASEPQAGPTPEPHKSGQESPCQPEQAAHRQTERPEETPVMIDWPYPAITCPPEPDPMPEIGPYITAPEQPTYTPEPEPTEQPQEAPAPTPQPVPDAPVDPAPEPTEQPANPTPEPPAEQPSNGHAECSCGARLTPEELLPHMKAHAMNGETHSYRAY